MGLRLVGGLIVFLVGLILAFTGLWVYVFVADCLIGVLSC